MRRICKSRKYRFKADNVEVINPGLIHVYPDDETKDGINLNLEMLNMQSKLRHIIVCGLPDISRAVITIDDSKNPPTYKLCIEGTGLLKVIATQGVIGTKTYSNNVCEVFHTLGVEAARTIIIKEITQVMEGHGISVDFRHIMLLASQMTARGNVLGITRYGLSKMRESVFNLASVSKCNAVIYIYINFFNDICSLRKRLIIYLMPLIMVK